MELSPLQLYTMRVLRRWPVIVAMTLIGAAVSGVWSMTTSATSWTATSALTTQSTNRGPEQDAVLALGYVDYFNQDAYQDLLRSEAPIPDGIGLSASTGATSPILYIEASGADEEEVRRAVSIATETFRNDVRRSLVQERERAAADLQAEINSNVDAVAHLATTDVEKNVILDQIRSLQGRLTDILADNTNHLKPLQQVPGIASSSPSPVTDVAVGAVGGALLGVLAALLLVVLDTRIRTRHDVRQRLGLDTVDEFEKRDPPELRARRVRNLANAFSLESKVVVAVVAPRRSPTSARLARELAAVAAARTSQAVLVQADLATDTGRPGLVDLLSKGTSVGTAIVTEADGLPVLPTGVVNGHDPYSLIDPGRLVRIVDEVGNGRSLVVVDAPPVLDAAESQVVCATADHVLLVLDRGVTRWTDARDAVNLLKAVRVSVFGVAIDDPEPVPRPQEEPARPAEKQPVQVADGAGDA